MCKILITGGAGFIGSNLVALALNDGYDVINLDALTYAGNIDSLRDISAHPKYKFIHGDIRNTALVSQLLMDEKPDAILHLAAESHVDRSIDAPADFVSTNVVGTFSMLEAARAYWVSLADSVRSHFRFLHVSTDEVYGSLGKTGYFKEATPYSPHSPYSASKAASDHFVRAYHSTYGLPTLVTNCSNNYGPKQFPEKLIPLAFCKILSGETIPVYGDGSNVRDWLYVEDHCRALLSVLKAGLPGETYNIGGNCERTNLEVVEELCRILDQESPRQDGIKYENQISFVSDRPGHDLRYAIDAGKIKREINWTPRESFSTGLAKTVDWYLSHQDWIERIRTGKYRGERLGLAEEKEALR